MEKAYLSRVRSSRIHCPRVLLAWDLPHAHGQTRVWTLPPGHYQPQCGTPPESNPSLCPTGPFLCLGRGSPSADQNSLCPGGVPAAAVAWNSRQTDSPGGAPRLGPKGLLPKVGNILSKQGKGPQCLVAVSQTPQPRRLEAPSRQIPFSSSSEHQPHTARVPRKASLASSPARPLRRVRRGKQAPGCPMRPWPHWCAGAFPCFPLMPKASSCVEEPALASKGIRFTGGIEPHIHTELRRSWPGSSRSHTRQGKALEAAPWQMTVYQ